MARKKANELDFSNIKLEIVLYGTPGVGKSTTALSAGRVLLVDIEEGQSRVAAPHRKDTLELPQGKKTGQKALDEIKNDLSGDLSDIDTIAIDTSTKLLDIIKTSILESGNSKAKQADGTLTQNGWGLVANKWEEFRQFLLSLNKHIIWICHSTEVKDNDEDAKTRVRIDLQGSTKNNIFKGATLVGFMEMKGKNRTISFKPTERYYAKSSQGVEDTYILPALTGKNSMENNFLETLIDTYRTNLIENQSKYSEDLKLYNEAMVLVPEIQEITNVEELQNVVEKIKLVTHALTSREELLGHVSAKASELGAVYDKKERRYVISTTE